MSVPAILLPVFVLVALTFALLMAAALKRNAAIVSGAVHPKDVALRQPNWPERATVYINAYHNQLELPVLFYALVAFAMITRQADFLFVAMSWIFVVFRLLQAYIFVTSNNIRLRGLFFAGGCATLMLMWIIFAVRILTA
jgi:hypothetical protein